MKITTNNNEILISVEKNALSITDIQRLLDFLRLREITYKSKASDKDAENLINEIKTDWYKKNTK